MLLSILRTGFITGLVLIFRSFIPKKKTHGAATTGFSFLFPPFFFPPFHLLISLPSSHFWVSLQPVAPLHPPPLHPYFRHHLDLFFSRKFVCNIFSFLLYYPVFPHSRRTGNAFQVNPAVLAAAQAPVLTMPRSTSVPGFAEMLRQTANPPNPHSPASSPTTATGNATAVPTVAAAVPTVAAAAAMSVKVAPPAIGVDFGFVHGLTAPANSVQMPMTASGPPSPACTGATAEMPQQQEAAAGSPRMDVDLQTAAAAAAAASGTRRSSSRTAKKPQPFDNLGNSRISGGATKAEKGRRAGKGAKVSGVGASKKAPAAITRVPHAGGASWRAQPSLAALDATGTLAADHKPARGRGRQLQLAKMTPAQKKAEAKARLEKNRQAARGFRAKCKNHVFELEQQILVLEQRDQERLNTIRELQEHIARMQQQGCQ